MSDEDLLKYKIVVFEGKEYSVPQKAKFIARDGNDSIYWYAERPVYSHADEQWEPVMDEYGFADFADDINASQSLKEI